MSTILTRASHAPPRVRALLLGALVLACGLAGGRPLVFGAGALGRHVILENLALAAMGIAASWIYVLSTLSLGDASLRWLRAEPEGYALVIKATAGAAVLSAAMTVLSLTHLAYPAVVAAVAFAPLAACWRPGLLAASVAPPVIARDVSRVGARLVWLLLTPYLAYVLFNCITNPTGPDLGIYHLVIPRDVLRDHGFRYNAFSHAAGLQLGWHHYGIPAYLLGGERAYLCLSFWAFSGLLWLVCTAVREALGESSAFWPAASAVVVSFVLCGMSLGSISNNDVPLLLLESVGLVLAIHKTVLPERPRAILLGLLIGFMLSVKLTALPSALLLGLIFLFRWRPAPRSLGRMALVAFPLALAWPLVSLRETGSPLPFCMLLLRTQGPPPLFVQEAFAQMLRYFGAWYAKNFSRLFTGYMLGYCVLVAGVLPGLLIRSYRSSRIVWAVAGFAFARYALVNLSAGKLDPMILFHDRYHLLSYLCLALLGGAGWAVFLARHVASKRRQAVLVLAVLAVIELNQLGRGFKLYFPTPPDFSFVAQKVPSIATQLSTLKDDFRREPGAQFGATLHWMARNLPADAIVAGTAIAPYGADRRYLQLLPVSQESIDLTLPPEQLLARLRELGVTHLHLTLYSGLPTWCVPEQWRWLQSVGRIPELPGVQRLQIEKSGEEVIEAVYDLRSASAPSPAGVRSNSGFFPPPPAESARSQTRVR